jgi:chromosome segregation ATPase
MTVDDQFNSLNEKLQLLLKQHNRLKKENDRLREELDAQKQKELETQQTVQELHQQISILKVASGDLSAKDKKDFERKINQYVKEIDKCIAFLSQ